MHLSSRPLGEFLVERKVLSRDDLEANLVEEAATGVPLANILAGKRLVGERDLVAAVADQLHVPFWDPDRTPILAMVSGMLPANLATELVAVAVGIEDGQLVVAMENPTDQKAVNQLAQATGWPLRPALGARADIVSAHMDVYGSPRAPVADAAVADAESGEAGEPELHLNTLLTQMVELGASDLHLTTGAPPSVRIDGEIRPLPDHPEMTGSELRRLIYGVLPQRMRERFEAEKELDTSHAVPDVGRFRLNVFLQRDSIGAVLRAIPYEIVPLEKLGIPAVVGSLASLPRGLVLVTGPTGSGKSTTLASLIDIVNQERALHIMTVEDPIEFLHHHKRCVVNQREVGEDTHSFAEALKHVLRQDPDVILVGELRDLETISTALTAAETGHLVFATLHTQDAPQSIDRVIDVFPSHQQQQIRVQLAATVQAIITQQLVPRMHGRGRAVACEVLVATPAVRNLIREGKVHQIYSTMQAGGKHGMQTMDQSLAQLVRTRVVSMEMALERCHHEEDLRRLANSAA